MPVFAKIASYGVLIALAGAEVDYSRYVNPLIGGEGEFPGLACRRFCLCMKLQC
jgi:hypothetical protein